jgi:hypothetical protein
MNDTTNVDAPPADDGDDEALGDDAEASAEGDGAGSDDVDSATLRKRFRAFLEPHVRARPRDDADAPPASVGGYEIGEFLGQGAMGRVYAAKQRATGRRVAIKFARAGTPHAARLEREARALGSIEHRHVAEVVAFDTDAGWAFLATRLIEGCTLADWIAERKGRPRSPEEVRTVLGWFRDLARALHASHGAGFVHLDVKPANVMIGVADAGGRSEASLVDYGLSTRAGARTTALALGGTVPYMSPEQTLARPESVDGRSDVYSLAATFYEALAGVRAVDFDARHETVESLRRKVALEPTPAVSRAAPGLGAQFDALFAHAMRKSPDERYRTAAELADDVERVLAGKAPLGVRESLRVRLWRRRRAAALAAFAVVVAVVWSSATSPGRRADAARRAIEAADDSGRLRDDPDGAFEAFDVISDEELAHPDVLPAARRLVATHGAAVSGAMLREQPFVATTVADDARNAARGRRAERLLAVVGDDGDELRFQAAFYRLIGGDYANAARFAGAAADPRRPRMRIISSVAAAEDDLGSALLATLGEPAPRDATVGDLALRAFGALFALDRGLGADVDDLGAKLSALEARLRRDAGGSPDDLRFATALRARFAEVRGRPDEALETARTLLYSALPRAQRAGVAIFCASFAIRAAADGPPERRAAAAIEAREFLRAAFEGVVTGATQEAADLRGATAEVLTARLDDRSDDCARTLVRCVAALPAAPFTVRFRPYFMHAWARASHRSFVEDSGSPPGELGPAAERFCAQWHAMRERVVGFCGPGAKPRDRAEAAAYFALTAYDAVRLALDAAKQSATTPNDVRTHRNNARAVAAALAETLSKYAPDETYAAEFAAALRLVVEDRAHPESRDVGRCREAVDALRPGQDQQIQTQLQAKLRSLIEE